MAARLLGLCVRISPEAWTSVCCECCVLSGRVLCVGSTTRSEQSYRLWFVVASEFESLYQHSHGGSVENQETLSQDSLSASRNFNPGLPEQVQ